MQCTSLRTVGFRHDGKTLAWSQKHYSKEFATFQIPCGKCLPCRLNYAREWAIRCVHEASVFGEKNSFITLTYSDEHLLSDKLQYTDFELFAKRLRKHIFDKEFLPSIGMSREEYSSLDKETRKELYEPFKIGIFVTGEYGDKTKRPHWHALIFNWRPKDGLHVRSNERGDKIYCSKTLADLWRCGFSEFGDVTLHSAGYVARYAAKKLVHGNDGDHEFHPISKKSSHQAIGKRFIEKNWEYVFAHGRVHLGEGKFAAIPRYYQKWLQKHKRDAYSRYVTNKKLELSERAREKKEKEVSEYNEHMWSLPMEFPAPITRIQSEYQVLLSKFKLLQSKLKL